MGCDVHGIISDARLALECLLLERSEVSKLVVRRCFGGFVIPG